jgi:hypothetical protein
MTPAKRKKIKRPSLAQNPFWKRSSARPKPRPKTNPRVNPKPKRNWKN